MKKSTIIVSVILGIIFLSVITIAVVVALEPIGSRSKTRLGKGDNVIEFIGLNGEVTEGGDTSLLSSGGSITPAFVRHRLEKANDDPSVKAIVFKVNSPGGTVGASQEIAELIRNSGKPVVIFAGDMVASGAYYFSSQADKIVSKPGSLIGSIGVISQIPDLSGLYDKLGIKMQTIKSGKNKDMFERTLTDEEKQKFQALSDETYKQFIDDVAVGRNLQKDKVQVLATGEVFPATVAKKYGLVDEIGGYQTAIDVAAKLAHVKNPDVREYEPTLFEEFFGAPVESISNLFKFQSLARDLIFLENMRSSAGMPQYRFDGGI